MKNFRSFFRKFQNCRFNFLSWLMDHNKQKITYYKMNFNFRSIEKTRTPFLIPWAFSLWSGSTKDNKESNVLQIEKARRAKLLEEVDELFDSFKYREIIVLLEGYKDSEDVEILWRLVRAQYKLSKEKGLNEAKKKSLIYEAYSLISQALDIDDNHYAAHKWMSVLLDERSAYDGLKARITQLERVKSHMLRASELNPKDATTLHMLGSWCYRIADMPWLQRKIAATIFVAPPTSTYEEALSYFLKAEETEPRFYSENLLMLGKTYLKLNKEEPACYYLYLAKNYPPTTEEDQMVRKEASQLLASLKPKSAENPLSKSV